MLEISKILIFEFWYNYVNSKYGEKVKSCYMDTESCIVYIKDIYLDIAKEVESRFDTLNCEIERPLPKEKIKKVNGLMKDKIVGNSDYITKGNIKKYNPNWPQNPDYWKLNIWEKVHYLI